MTSSRHDGAPRGRSDAGVCKRDARSHLKGSAIQDLRARIRRRKREPSQGALLLPDEEMIVRDAGGIQGSKCDSQTARQQRCRNKLFPSETRATD